MQYNCTLHNWVPWKAVPQTVQLMRSLSVIIAMLISSTMVGQAYNCGMFGMIEDDFGNGYIGRFDMTLDSVQLESMATCKVFTAPTKVWDIKNGGRWTKIWMDIEHPDFDAAGYKIKYPSGSWQIIRENNNVIHSDTYWPMSPLD